MGRNKSLSWILAFWKKVALSIISERAVQWKWALLHVFLAERSVRSTSRALRVAEGQSRFWEPSNNRVIMDTGASGLDLAIWLFPIKCEAAVALYLLKSLESIWGETLSHLLLSPHPKHAALLSEDREGQGRPVGRSPTEKSCLSYLSAKQWDTDPAIHFPMPLLGDKEDRQQNKKQIWMLLKVVRQTDSGHSLRQQNKQMKPMWG